MFGRLKRHAGAIVLVVLFLPLRGCGRPQSVSPTERAAIFSIEETLRILPEIFGGKKVWSLDREPTLSASLIDPRGLRVGMRQTPHARTRLFVLKGTLRVRAGAEERVMRAGSFVSIPRGMLRRLSPVGEGQVLYLRLLTPDVDKDIELETPPAPRLRKERARADAP